MASQVTSKMHVLILGLGECGTGVLEAFLAHPAYDPSSTQLSIMVRPIAADASAASKTAKKTQTSEFKKRGVATVFGDLDSSSLDELAELFRPANVVIHAGGFSLSPGVQIKVTKAVFAVGTVQTYIPWQFGVDYDQIGYEGGRGIFTEQLDVRKLLRSQNDVNWLIIDCGIFMTLLFESYWGIIERHSENGKIAKVRALGSWDDLLTSTTPKDIGRATAEVLLVNSHLKNQTVYIAGDSMTYAEFADVVEKVNGREIERELWTTGFLRRESEADPDNELKKYRVVFSEGKGLAWPMDQSWNYMKPAQFQMTGFEKWMGEIGI